MKDISEWTDFRLFRIICILLILAGAFWLAEDLWRSSPAMNLSVDAMVIITGWIHYFLLSRGRYNSKVVYSFLLAVNIIALYAWFNMGGFVSAAGMGMVAALAITILLYPNREASIVLIFCVIYLPGLALIQYLTGWSIEGLKSGLKSLPITYLPPSLSILLLMGYLKKSLINERLAQKSSVHNLDILNRELKSIVAQQNETLIRLHATQRRLIETEKMATVGRVTAELAHELNNPINYIGGSIFAIEMHLETLKSNQEGFKEDDSLKEIEELFRNVKDGAERTTDIVKKLLKLTPNVGLGKMDTRDVELIEIVENNVTSIQRNYPDLTINLNGLSDVILGFSADDQYQIIYNCITSVIDANFYDPESNFIIVVKVEDGPSGFLINIRPENVVRNLDWRQKFEEKPLADLINSNLGLSVAHSLVIKNGGEISFQGKGMESFGITITFPKKAS